VSALQRDERASFVTPCRAASCAAGSSAGRARGAVGCTAVRPAVSAPTGSATQQRRPRGAESREADPAEVTRLLNAALGLARRR